MKRRRFGQPASLEEQLLQEAEQVRKQAERLPPGEDRDLLLEDRELLLKKARDAALSTKASFARPATAK